MYSGSRVIIRVKWDFVKINSRCVRLMVGLCNSQGFNTGAEDMGGQLFIDRKT